MRKSVYFSIPRAAIIAVSGRHAARYLNNRFTNDISRLKSGESVNGDLSIRAGALNAQGRLEGLFTVLNDNSSSGTFLLVCDAGKGDAEFMSALSRYKVADDVQFTERSDLRLIHGNEAFFDEVKGMAVAHWNRNRGLESGTDILVPIGSILPEQELEHDVVTRLRVVSGEPQFGTDFDSDTLLAEIGLLDSISFTKGCYVGQEVVARVDALGKPPRVIVRGSVSGTDDLSDSTITSPGRSADTESKSAKRRPVGEVTTSIVEGDRRLCFSFLRNDDQIIGSEELLVGERAFKLIERLK